MATAVEMKGADAVIRVRRERVHTTMLVEVLALLVFLAMGFAFVSRDEMALNPMIQRLEEMERRLQEQAKSLQEAVQRARELQLQNEQLQEALRRFAGQRNGTLPANDQLVIPRQQFAELTADLANKNAIIETVQQSNAQLRERLTGRGGSDLPNCPVTPGFLLTISLNGNGSFSVSPAWNSDAATAVARVDGAAALGSSSSLSSAQFRGLAERVKSWGRAQNPPCAFRVRVRTQHRSLELFQRQHRLVAQYFYTAW
jgi:hypothetical protein